MRVARNNTRWREDQHHRTAVDFRRGVAELLACCDEALPWDDVRRVVQSWAIARFRLRWGAVVDGDKQDGEESGESEDEEESEDDDSEGEEGE